MDSNKLNIIYQSFIKGLQSGIYKDPKEVCILEQYFQELAEFMKHLAEKHADACKDCKDCILKDE